jgi:serine/threonine protein kinase
MRKSFWRAVPYLAEHMLENGGNALAGSYTMARCLSCMEESIPLENGNCTICHEPMVPLRRAGDELPPGTQVQLGRYQLGKCLNEGGFGKVYIAYDEKLSRKIAIKELYPGDLVHREGMEVKWINSKQSQFDGLRQRFLAECQTLAKLNEINGLLRVFDYFEGNGTAYMVMEYLKGITLSELLRYTHAPAHLKNSESLFDKEGRLKESFLFAVMESVLDVLDRLHQKGIYHLDLNPANIFLRENPNDYTPVVIDLGNFKGQLATDSKESNPVVTAGYAPPEQYGGDRDGIGAQTDIYGAAATFYHALTKEKPPDALSRSSGVPLARPSILGAKISHEAEAALLKAMALPISARFQNAREFKRALMHTNSHKGLVWTCVVGGVGIVMLLFVFYRPKPHEVQPKPPDQPAVFVSIGELEIRNSQDKPLPKAKIYQFKEAEKFSVVVPVNYSNENVESGSIPKLDAFIKRANREITNGSCKPEQNVSKFICSFVVPIVESTEEDSVEISTKNGINKQFKIKVVDRPVIDPGLEPELQKDDKNVVPRS